ncbi:MAG: M15 family metallopeptidase, partial [Bacteroidales bacterium]|nr:M15 family metallopeptidase [Bacteroidales bacterium]
MDKQLLKISDQLDKHPDWAAYLQSAGAYHWRTIADSDQLSAHSFGIAIDINAAHLDYWLQDYGTRDEYTPIVYRNRLPIEIVDI